MRPHKKRPEIICKCNEVDRLAIEQAICAGAKTLNEIFDHTTAGVGPCGGSCRGKLQHLLESYQSAGEFPKTIIDLWARPAKK